MNMDEFNAWSFIERQPGKMMYGVDVNDLIWKESYMMRKITFRGHAYTLTLLKNEDWDILDGEDTQRQINFFL